MTRFIHAKVQIYYQSNIVSGLYTKNYNDHFFHLISKFHPENNLWRIQGFYQVRFWYSRVLFGPQEIIVEESTIWGEVISLWPHSKMYNLNFVQFLCPELF